MWEHIFSFMHSQVNMRILTVGEMIFCYFPASELGTTCLLKTACGTYTIHRVELIQIPGVSISVQKLIFQSFEASACFQAQRTESWHANSPASRENVHLSFASYMIEPIFVL